MLTALKRSVSAPAGFVPNLQSLNSPILPKSPITSPHVVMPPLLSPKIEGKKIVTPYKLTLAADLLKQFDAKNDIQLKDNKESCDKVCALKAKIVTKIQEHKLTKLKESVIFINKEVYGTKANHTIWLAQCFISVNKVKLIVSKIDQPTTFSSNEKIWTLKPMAPKSSPKIPLPTFRFLYEHSLEKVSKTQGVLKSKD